jgi:hypothetical protein
MIINTIIIDDFLDNPDAVRQSVLTLEFNGTGSFPGVRSDRPEKDYELYVQEKIEGILNCRITEWSQDSFRFQLCISKDETWVHKDDGEWAGVLYLTPDAPAESGTGIYRESNNDWELITAIGNVYNRLVLYRSNLFHKSIVPGFGNDINTGRLTQVLFFKTEDYHG